MKRPDAVARSSFAHRPPAAAPPRRRASLRGLSLLLSTLLFVSSAGLSLGLAAQDARVATTVTVRFVETATGVPLVGTWYRTGSDRGVVLAPGFGFDRATLRPAALAFARAGVDVFVFDLPGHGDSGGKLALDNAATDRTARAYGDAVAAFLDRSGISPGRLVLGGHSLGARSALQYASGSDVRYAGLVLIGTSVALVPSTSSGSFPGTDDRTLEWVARLGPSRPGLPTALLSGTWDDVLTPLAARTLYERLSGEDARLFPGSRETGAGAPETWLSPDGRTQLSLYPSVLHLFEPWTPSILSGAVAFASDLTGGTKADPAPAARLAAWLAAFVLLAAAVLVAVLALRPDAIPGPAPRAFRTARYLGLRLALWIPALLLAALFCGAALLVPVGLPVLTLVYAAPLGGFGLVGFAAARYLPRAATPLTRPTEDDHFLRHGDDDDPEPAWRVAATGLPLLVLLFAAFALWAGGGWHPVVPTAARLLWILVFTAFTVPGFLAVERESAFLRASGAGGFARTLLAFVQYLPFFGMLLAFGALGSPSGAVGAALALVALGFALAAGRFSLYASRERWIGAIVASLVLQVLIQVQGALVGF